VIQKTRANIILSLPDWWQGEAPGGIWVAGMVYPVSVVNDSRKLETQELGENRRILAKVDLNLPYANFFYSTLTKPKYQDVSNVL
jgi:hypothetical protein